MARRMRFLGIGTARGATSSEDTLLSSQVVSRVPASDDGWSASDTTASASAAVDGLAASSAADGWVTAAGWSAADGWAVPTEANGSITLTESMFMFRGRSNSNVSSVGGWEMPSD